MAVLREIGFGRIEARAERELIASLREIAIERELHGCARHALAQREPVIESLGVARARRQRRIVIVVDVAADVVLVEATIVGKAREQRAITDVARRASSKELHLVLRTVGPGVCTARVP